MQSLRDHGLQHLLLRSQPTNLTFTRHASLTSAISRGIRKGAGTVDRLGTYRRDTKSDESDVPPPRTRREIERAEASKQYTPRPKRWRNDQPSISYEAPLGIPYTTAGSEFIYGTFAVKAALEANRRKLYKLYLWKGDEKSMGSENVSDVGGKAPKRTRPQVDKEVRDILELAKSKEVEIQMVAGTWDRLLSKMSNQRPHNGFVLEASALPKLPIISLGKVEHKDRSITVSVPPQSEEDLRVNESFNIERASAQISRGRFARPYPLLLYLDRVTDTGNMGAILRSAYFFGVNAIIIPEHGTAPLSPVTIKASGGAAEHVPILTVRKEVEFVQSSQKNGWKFFASVAPDSASYLRKSENTTFESAATALDKSPCVLMLGNEGEGLRPFIQHAADELVSIQGAIGGSGVIDSLNVSAAAALLIYRFEPASAPPKKRPLERAQAPLKEESNEFF